MSKMLTSGVTPKSRRAPVAPPPRNPEPSNGLHPKKGALRARALSMWTLTTISILVGGGLGLRFNLFILVPTIGLALTMVVVTGMARGDGAWSLMVTMVDVIPSVGLHWRERFSAAHRSR